VIYFNVFIGILRDNMQFNEIDVKQPLKKLHLLEEGEEGGEIRQATPLMQQKTSPQYLALARSTSSFR
jgi:hypothetical protein